MDFLDSQHLTHQDSYVHQFSQAGEYEYQIFLLGAGSEHANPTRYRITVVPPKSSPPPEPKQADISLHFNDQDLTYAPNDVTPLTITANDYVMWHSDESALSAPPYVIKGFKHEQPPSTDVLFDSQSLVKNDVFTHFFAIAGRYAYQVNDKVFGLIVVASHLSFRESEYLKKIKADPAPLVAVSSDKLDPVSLDAVAGQTVVWHVVAGDRLKIKSVEPTPHP